MTDLNSEMKRCVLCPRHCGADRTERKGACGSGALLRVARAALHFGEEPCISGTAGSGAVFFTGCALRCRFCQNREISRGEGGEEISVQRLAGIFRELEEQGAANINLVTADHWTPQVRAALELYRPGIPVLFNCSGYETAEMLKSLEGLVDVWLPDIKYSDPRLADRLSSAPDYPETAFRAVREMLRHAFEDIGMRCVWCGYYGGNTKSKRVQEKCGFRYQWTAHNVDVPLLHEKRTEHVNRITKEEWLADNAGK